MGNPAPIRYDAAYRYAAIPRNPAMTRRLVTAAAQLGPIHRADSRESVVKRLVELLRQAADRGCKLVVYPELALTTFFRAGSTIRRMKSMRGSNARCPTPRPRPLFDEAKRLGIGFHLGYAELCEENGALHRYNTANPRRSRRQHRRQVPNDSPAGHRGPGAGRAVPPPGEALLRDQGDLGFPVWRAHDAIIGMCICNDDSAAGRRRSGSWD